MNNQLTILRAMIVMLLMPSGVVRAGLMKNDASVTCNGTEVKTVAGLRDRGSKDDGKKLALTIIRKQKPLPIRVGTSLTPRCSRFEELQVLEVK